MCCAQYIPLFGTNEYTILDSRRLSCCEFDSLVASVKTYLYHALCLSFSSFYTAFDRDNVSVLYVFYIANTNAYCVLGAKSLLVSFSLVDCFCCSCRYCYCWSPSVVIVGIALRQQKEMIHIWYIIHQ